MKYKLQMQVEKISTDLFIDSKDQLRKYGSWSFFI